jgi:hypothetical protein
MSYMGLVGSTGEEIVRLYRKGLDRKAPWELRRAHLGHDPESLAPPERGSYTPKNPQNSYTAQPAEVQFPSHVVFWTGHTLTIRERHYIEENAYLPHAERDYGRIGTLSAHVQAALRKFARYSGEMGQGVTAGGNHFPVT